MWPEPPFINPRVPSIGLPAVGSYNGKTLRSPADIAVTRVPVTAIVVLDPARIAKGPPCATSSSVPASSESSSPASCATEGHQVVGTTTTPAKVDGLKEVFDDVRVLEGVDRELIRDALAGVDGVVVSVGPRAVYDEDDREPVYRDALVDTAESVVWAVKEAGPDRSGHRDVVELRLRRRAERPRRDPRGRPAHRRRPGEPAQLPADGADLPRRACPARPSSSAAPRSTATTRRRSRTSCAARTSRWAASCRSPRDALLYRTHVTEVASATSSTRWAGGWPASTTSRAPRCRSPTRSASTASASIGLPPFTYLGVIAAPSKPLSVERLAATGFRVTR